MAVAAGSMLATAVAVHTAVNLRRVPTARSGAPVPEPVSVLVPARDEEDRVEATVRSLLAQTGVPDLEIIVLDDASTDRTGAVIARLAGEDQRVVVLHGVDEPPRGWLGKPWACSRLADQARGRALVFVDADVLLAPDAVNASVRLLRAEDLALLAPYPRQVARSWLERLVQPLVAWSPLALLPLGWQRRSSRPSLSAANGQLLVLDAAAYRAAGGHAAVRDRVVEDVALMTTMRRMGFRAWTIDGSGLATCRMYDGPSAVVDGYAKSLWSAFGGPAGSAAVTGALVLGFVVPAAAALASGDRRTRVLGVVGYAAGVASRTLVSRRTGESSTDALAHPASVVAFVALSGVSWWRHLRGTAQWKGRPVIAA